LRIAATRRTPGEERAMRTFRYFEQSSGRTMFPHRQWLRAMRMAD
jgi:hypothetical protein